MVVVVVVFAATAVAIVNLLQLNEHTACNSIGWEKKSSRRSKVALFPVAEDICNKVEQFIGLDGVDSLSMMWGTS